MIEPFLFSMMCFYGHQKTLRTVLSCQLSPQPQAEFRQEVRNECLKKKTEGGGGEGRRRQNRTDIFGATVCLCHCELVCFDPVFPSEHWQSA